MKRIQLIWGALIVTLTLGFALCNYLTARRAKEFVTAVRQLEVGSNESTRIVSIAKRFRSNVTNKSTVCDLKNCSVEFAFQNPFLRFLGVRTLSRLDAGLRVENHKIGYLGIFYGIGGGASPASTVSVLEFDDSGPQNFRLDVLPRGNGVAPKIFVRFDKRASDSEKQSIFDLNLSCLNTPFRCRDAYDLAPSLPHRPEARSLLPSAS